MTCITPKDKTEVLIKAHKIVVGQSFIKKTTSLSNADITLTLIV